MKNNRPILLAAIVLAVAALAMFIFQKTGTIRRELRDFAVKDTAAITKIFLADRTGKQIILERVSSSEWTVNGKYPARRASVKLLLRTIAGVEVISPVAKTAYNNIVKSLASGGIKTEIYVNGKLEKTYYVGGQTQDDVGTYMMLEGSSMPFVMGLPGFQGYLTTRYFVFEQDWRDKRLFAYDNPSDIAKIVLKNNEIPEQSFSVEKSGNDFVVKPVSAKYANAAFDKSRIQAYVANFHDIPIEAFINHKTLVKDSVKKVMPFNELSVTDTKGKTVSIKLIYMPNTYEKTDPQGRLYAHETDRAYVLFNNDQDLGLMQYTTIDKALKTPAFFTGSDKKPEGQK